MVCRSVIAAVCVLCLCRISFGDPAQDGGPDRHPPATNGQGSRNRSVDRRDNSQPSLSQLQQQISQLSKQVEKLQKTLDQQHSQQSGKSGGYRRQSRISHRSQAGFDSRGWQRRGNFPRRRMMHRNMMRGDMMREQMMNRRMGRRRMMPPPPMPQQTNNERETNRPHMHGRPEMMGPGDGWMDRPETQPRRRPSHPMQDDEMNNDRPGDDRQGEPTRDHRHRDKGGRPGPRNDP